MRLPLFSDGNDMLLESSEGLQTGLLGEVQEIALLLALPVPTVPPLLFRLPAFP